ncbi:muts domain V-domain-containing protein [Amylostereum chailletii]|nr:muts domain V-domain-containing protein [Amylostereum chailletii]
MRPRTASTTRPQTGQSRPWTAQSSTTRPRTASRPNTARPTTATSSRHESSFVVALLEGRGVAREVGIAALDRDTGHAVLVQLSDYQTYVKTLQQLHVHRPGLILVPDTFISAAETIGTTSGKQPTTTSFLVHCVQDEFPGVPIEPVPRKYWNDDAGLQFINQLCVQDDERAATLLAASNKYYVLSAAAALFKHSELKLNTRFAPASLRIRFAALEGTMMIDPETVRNLELVGNMTYKKSPHSLFGVLNHTYTAMASRLLRGNIIAPITAQAAIDARLDVVEELVQSEDLFTAVKDRLKHLNKMDFDKLISSLAASEARETNTARMSSNRVAQMLNLRNLVKNLPPLEKALAGGRSKLLQIIRHLLADDRIPKIEAVVCGSLNEDATPQKGGIAGVNARVYAVKANCNPLLDVARETYKENVGDIQALHRDLCEKHELPLQLVYQDSGFVFAIKKSDLEALDGKLPIGFINQSMQKGRWLFTTLELKKRNARLKDALDEALILSHSTIQGLVKDILEHAGALYKASEAVALLDMLWSFAHVSILRNYVRPEFTGTLAIKAGRHPILESLQFAGALVPNDMYVSESSAFQIVQGPNMSGKSTYLKQIGLLSVMALCGCFVPAEYASFRIHDALLTRLSNDDDMEKSLSTFANEMASSAMILGLASSESLILIDELGRGTSPVEGIGISHAIAEVLIDMKCYVFFATHFHELSVTLSRQPTVVNLHLSVHKSRPSSSNIGMAFQYKIVDGPPDDMDHYGSQSFCQDHR